VRVIIDTDPGIDDAQAIIFAIACGQFDIEAITTVFGNCRVPNGTRNALHLLELTGRLDIPVYRGAAGPLVRRRMPKAGVPLVHGRTGTGAVKLPATRLRATGSYAAVELARRVVAAPGQITVLALGPLTNVALAIRLEPRFIDAVARMIWMGGIVRGRGNVGPFATANVLNDAEAAAVVFAESRGKLTMVGQDVTRHVRIHDDRFEKIGAYGKAGQYLHSIAAHYRDFYREAEPDHVGFPVHDLVAVVHALRPDLFVVEDLPVRVETSGEFTTGMTVLDLRPYPAWPADIRVCTGADGEAILELYEEVLCGAARQT
jgi:inosine-uridine nucleoside N-ribohydrolase